MLTNFLSQLEIAALVPGATVHCIVPVVMRDSGETTFAAGKRYEVAEARSQHLGLINNGGRRHWMDGFFFRDHFVITPLSASSK